MRIIEHLSSLSAAMRELSALRWGVPSGSPRVMAESLFSAAVRDQLFERVCADGPKSPPHRVRQTIQQPATEAREARSRESRIPHQAGADCGGRVTRLPFALTSNDPAITMNWGSRA